MVSTQQLILPDDRFRLEEINMPAELAAALAGQSVFVKVLPEVPSRTLRIDLDNPPEVGVSVIVDDDGTSWNDDWPARVLYTDPEGREWRLPRHWLSDGVSPVIAASRYNVTQESRWTEIWVPPTLWDLGDINIQDVPGPDGGIGSPEIEVRVSPGEIPKAFWSCASCSAGHPRDKHSVACCRLLESSLPELPALPQRNSSLCSATG